MRVSAHFTEDEFTCRCGCGQCIVVPELVDTMEMIRNFIDKPVIVHCVNRCPQHNADVGGKENSEHIIGRACDFHVKWMRNKKLHKILLHMFDDDIVNDLGLYNWGVHVGI